MNTILIVGDSITAGIPGARYTSLLRGTLPDHRFIIRGQSSDTLAGASRRAKAILAKTSPDVLVFEIGANDVLLPYLARRNRAWRTSVRLLEKRGSIATTDTLEFYELYSRTIEEVAGYGVPHIIVTTITCLGEELTSPLNIRRETFNSQIQRLAQRERVHLADAGGVFDDLLGGVANPSPCLLPRFYLFWDTLVTRVEKYADSLSRRRQLRLTTDGVHLNRLGAQLVADTIAEQIRLLRQ